MKQLYHIANTPDFIAEISRPCVIFLYGDLGAGKTTLSSKIIQALLPDNDIQVTSPTYVYYNRYQDITHFDLYRLENYDGFVSIGGEEILENNTGVVLVEWPQILEPYFIPDIKIYLRNIGEDDSREIEILKRKDQSGGIIFE